MLRCIVVCRSFRSKTKNSTNPSQKCNPEWCDCDAGDVTGVFSTLRLNIYAGAFAPEASLSNLIYIVCDFIQPIVINRNLFHVSCDKCCTFFDVHGILLEKIGAKKSEPTRVNLHIYCSRCQ